MLRNLFNQFPDEMVVSIYIEGQIDLDVATAFKKVTFLRTTVLLLVMIRWYGQGDVSDLEIEQTVAARQRSTDNTHFEPVLSQHHATFARH